MSRWVAVGLGVFAGLASMREVTMRSDLQGKDGIALTEYLSANPPEACGAWAPVAVRLAGWYPRPRAATYLGWDPRRARSPEPVAHRPQPAFPLWKAAVDRAFARRGQPSFSVLLPLPPDPNRDLFLAFLSALRTRRFEVAESVAADARRQPATRGGSRFDLLARAVSGVGGLEEALAAWRHAHPDSAFALAVSGIYHKEMLSEARGNLYARYLRPGQQEAMAFHGEIARRDLSAALGRDPGIAEAWASLMALEMQIGDRGAREATWERAWQAIPGSLAIHEARLFSLLTRWGGDDQQMLAFARQAPRRPGAPATLETLLPTAHRYVPAADDPGRLAARDERTLAATRLLEALPDWSETWTQQIEVAKEHDVEARWIAWFRVQRALTGTTSWVHDQAENWILGEFSNPRRTGEAWLRELARLGLPRARYDLARLVQKGKLEAGDLGDPRVAIETAAEAGSKQAMAWLAWAYEYGKSVPLDPAKAVAWADRAAACFNPYGFETLGHAKITGRGLPQDVFGGLEDLLTSIALGNPRARRRITGLSELVLDSAAASSQASEARPLWEAAGAALQTPEARLAIAETQLYDGDLHIPDLEPKPMEEAQRTCFRGHYDRAFRLGLREAALHYANLVASGIGTADGKPDLTLACQWYRKAPELAAAALPTACR